MDTSKKTIEIRHDLRIRLYHLLGFERILEDDAREGSLEVGEALSVLRDRCESIGGIIGDLNENSAPADIEKISTLLLEIHGAAREEVRGNQVRKNRFVGEDLENILRASDDFIEYLRDTHDGLAVSSGGNEIEKFRALAAAPKTRTGVRTGTILVVDDNDIVRDILFQHLHRQGHRVVKAKDGREAFDLLRRQSLDLILLDIMMPGMNGYQFLEKLKADDSLRDIPVIMISAVEDPQSVARCIELGAEDFLPKSFEPVLLKARIETSLERKYLRDQEKLYISALTAGRRELLRELADASLYVRNLLPEPMTRPLRIDWVYHPSAELGGDSFGYHFLDKSRLALYLLDVSGHGIGAALLSISVLNILRHEALRDADFYDPTSVIASLNRGFRMEDQNNMYFTLWYAVLDIETKALRYCSAGAPPAVLIRFGSRKEGEVELLKTPGIAVGITEDAVYETREIGLDEGGKIYLFSDGTYEIRTKSGAVLTGEAFQELLSRHHGEGDSDAERIIAELRSLSKDGKFEDDLSLLEILIPRGTLGVKITE